MFYIYILYSIRLDVFYKGHCENIENRFQRHNTGLEIYTRKGMPWTLLWCIAKESKSEAYRLELKLKNLSRKRLVAFMLKYREGISSSDALFFIKQWSEC